MAQRPEEAAESAGYIGCATFAFDFDVRIAPQRGQIALIRWIGGLRSNHGVPLLLRQQILRRAEIELDVR